MAKKPTHMIPNHLMTRKNARSSNTRKKIAKMLFLPPFAKTHTVFLRALFFLRVYNSLLFD